MSDASWGTHAGQRSYPRYGAPSLSMLCRKVSNAIGSFSIANSPFQPARCKPSDKPPQPAKRSNARSSRPAAFAFMTRDAKDPRGRVCDCFMDTPANVEEVRNALVNTAVMEVTKPLSRTQSYWRSNVVPQDHDSRTISALLVTRERRAAVSARSRPDAADA